ncbi:RcpC/CpaB family pilus assembly protein [Streptomyces cinerochromogenes]|uniref:RcpC/CpaB family pilus assembly protein n=1 Tax=Streptomyces cinerochromogenes TaxID=66422 RepID=UPI00368B52B9
MSPPVRSPFPPPLRLPRPLGTDAPPTREVPPFDPVRVRGGRYRLQRLVRHRRRAVAAGLAVTAAALVAAGPRAGLPGVAGTEPHGADRPRGHPVAEPARGHPDAGAVHGHTVTAPVRRHPAADVVSAPVRIADAATVRLLRPGDRVDVIAAADPSAGGGEVRVLARGVRVTAVPEGLEEPEEPDAPGPSAGAAESGALVVLAVPRATAARLVGAGATARLAVTLC